MVRHTITCSRRHCQPIAHLTRHGSLEPTLLCNGSDSERFAVTLVHNLNNWWTLPDCPWTLGITQPGRIAIHGMCRKAPFLTGHMSLACDTQRYILLKLVGSAILSKSK